MSDTAADVIEKQFNAYNCKDADAWSATYAEDAIQLSVEGDILATGRKQIRERILPRFAEPDLQAILLHRTVYGNLVIDHEKVIRTFPEGRGSTEVLCIYLVENSLIKRASFKVFNQQLD